jgi:predicted Zn-ribbon and HTH transcriptional regulator
MTTPLDAINPFSNRVNDEIKEERMSICRSCPQILSFTTTCKKCGCFMNIKTRLADSECPIGKWNKIESN